MENMTEVVRVRMTPTEKERLFSEAQVKDIKVSDLLRNLLSEHFYVPTEEEKEKNAFLEKVKALRILTGMSIPDCKTSLIEAHGNPERAIMLLKNRQLPKCINVKKCQYQRD